MDENKEKNKVKLWFVLLVVLAVIGIAGEVAVSMTSLV